MTGPRPGPAARVLLGVAGGIAAYKAVSLLRLLREDGYAVRVIPTASALRFVGAATFEALSGEPVDTGVFSGVDEVRHVALGRAADLVVVAPATADLLARSATGRADDLLTTTLLTVTCPVLMAPAMHTEMWQHPATVANVATLRGRGVRVLEPDSGRLTGTDSGPGRLPEPAALHAAARGHLEAAGRGRDLAGVRVLVTGGGTREPLDPVRYLANRSSGKQGTAIAAAAAARGAEVTLVLTDSATVAVPAGLAHVVRVGTTAELAVAVEERERQADVVVMAAAPADFRPRERSATKIKKDPDAQEGPALALALNPDIVAGLVQRRSDGRQIVAFAAETGDATTAALDHGRAKHRRKGADVTVVNVVGDGQGFGSDENEAVLLQAGTEDEIAVPHGSKYALAHTLLDVVAGRRRD